VNDSKSAPGRGPVIESTKGLAEGARDSKQTAPLLGSLNVLVDEFHSAVWNGRSFHLSAQKETLWTDVKMQLSPLDPPEIGRYTLAGTGISLWYKKHIPFELTGSIDFLAQSVELIKQHHDADDYYNQHMIKYQLTLVYLPRMLCYMKGTGSDGNITLSLQSIPPFKTPLSEECIVCTEKPRAVAMIPCGHVCCCAACGSQCDTCPICRQRIASCQILFFC